MSKITQFIISIGILALASASVLIYLKIDTIIDNQGYILSKLHDIHIDGYNIENNTKKIGNSLGDIYFSQINIESDVEKIRKNF